MKALFVVLWLIGCCCGTIVMERFATHSALEKYATERNMSVRRPVAVRRHFVNGRAHAVCPDVVIRCCNGGGRFSHTSHTHEFVICYVAFYRYIFFIVLFRSGTCADTKGIDKKVV